MHLQWTDEAAQVRAVVNKPVRLFEKVEIPVTSLVNDIEDCWKLQ